MVQITGLAQVCAFAVVAAVVGGDVSAKCASLAGNWTSSKPGTPPASVVHIEFFQRDGEANFTLRATPWGAQVRLYPVCPPCDTCPLSRSVPARPCSVVVSGSPMRAADAAASHCPTVLPHTQTHTLNLV